MLYELAAGKRPFAGATPADIGSAILRDAPQPLTSLRRDLPADLDRIVEHVPGEEPARAVPDRAGRLERAASAAHGPGAERVGPHCEALVREAGLDRVLPFVNRSASADDEYFSDGLADELLNVLSKIKGLRVTARSSAVHTSRASRRRLPRSVVR